MTPQKFLNKVVPQTIELLQREYPNNMSVFLNEEVERLSPRRRHPAFYGCFDWHSAVHSTWQVVRAMRLFPEGKFVADGTLLLNDHLTPKKIAQEAAVFEARPRFELPYGQAWLLQLCAELREWNVPHAMKWHECLAPLEQHAYQEFLNYCSYLPHPVRSGVHNQTAFALGLAYDWAVVAGADDLVATIRETARRLFGDDRSAPLHLEPSAIDFLSPALAEADLMRRIFSPGEFVGWLDRFLPYSADRLTPVEVVDPSHGQLAHFAGLNLSRAWMMRNIARALPDGHGLKNSLSNNATQHIKAGFMMALHDDYMISHWVPSFAVYLLTKKGQ